MKQPKQNKKGSAVALETSALPHPPLPPGFTKFISTVGKTREEIVAICLSIGNAAVGTEMVAWCIAHPVNQDNTPSARLPRTKLPNSKARS